MKIDGTGAVNGGNDNTKWSNELAKRLDAADGSSDGKISASVWNKFLGDNNSKGNTIKFFIKVDRAEKSFDYYLNKKDKNVEGLDWKNWKKMFNVFLESDNTLNEAKKAELKFNLDATEEVEEPQQPAPKVEEPPTPQETDTEESGCDMTEVTAAFSNTLQESALKDMNKFDIETISKLEGFEEVTELPANAPEGAKLFKNNAGDVIVISPNPEDENTGILVYQKDNLIHKIVFDKNTNEFISGEITTRNADDTEKAYSYEYKDGAINNDTIQDMSAPESEQDVKPPTLEELKASIAELTFEKPAPERLTEAGFTEDTSTAQTDGSKVYVNNETGETIEISADGKSITYTKGDTVIEQKFNEDGEFKSGTIVTKKADGVFTTGVIELDNDGNAKVVEKLQHKMPTTAMKYAQESFKAFENSINTFRKKLSIPNDFKLLLKDFADNDAEKEITSPDGKYKIKISLNNDGSAKITYSQKQNDESYKEIGTMDIKKVEDPGSLRGYNYELSATDNLGNAYWQPERVIWTDFE